MDLKELYAGINDRMQLLESVCRAKQKALANAKSGSVRIHARGNSVECYLFNDETGKKGRYIQKKDMPLVRSLAQKAYNQQILDNAGEELRLVKRLADFYHSGKSMEDVYRKYSLQRQKMVTPITPTDEQYIAQWNKVHYPPLAFDNTTAPLLTARGERVRSKSELIFANQFDRSGVPYHYEPIVAVGDRRFRTDFECLNVRLRKTIYLEHFGMVGNESYTRRMFEKLQCYYENGFVLGDNFIFTMESDTCPLSIQMIDLIIRTYLI